MKSKTKKKTYGVVGADGTDSKFTSIFWTLVGSTRFTTWFGWVDGLLTRLLFDVCTEVSGV